MIDASTIEKAALLRSLHAGPALVLPNAWDAASAALFAQLGARAIATTSGGVAWANGFADGERASRESMIGALDRITRVVDLPVSADLEGGYGAGVHAIEQTVGAAIDVGAVGVNLEDSESVGGPLFSVEAQAERLHAGREAAVRHGLPGLFINARTDVFLFQIGDPADRFEEVRIRAEAYAEAGADCLFVPGLLDLATLAALTKVSPLPINAMAGPGGLTVKELSAVGVQRISVGTAIAQVAYAAAQRSAREMLEHGSFETFEGALDFGALNRLFSA